MQPLHFYNELPDMVCLSGDTLPVFTINVDIESLSGYRMHVIIETEFGNDVVLNKQCTELEDGTGFEVQITSADTAELSGIYKIYFQLTDTNELKYKKLYGTLLVRDVKGA